LVEEVAFLTVEQVLLSRNYVLSVFAVLVKVLLLRLFTEKNLSFLSNGIELSLLFLIEVETGKVSVRIDGKIGVIEQLGGGTSTRGV
jgi:hypothetical protein